MKHAMIALASLFHCGPSWFRLFWWLLQKYSLMSLVSEPLQTLLLSSYSLPLGIEFFYAQSPHTMRGMMVGLFFFAWGVASTLTELTIFMFRELSLGPLLSCDIWYYLILLMVGLVGFILYVVVARRYKNRQRGEIKPERFYRQLQ